MSLEEWQKENPSMKQDLKILYEMIIKNQPKIIAEIGTGHSTMAMALALKNCGREQNKIFTTDIDPDRVKYFIKKIGDCGLSKYCIFYEIDSIDFFEEFTDYKEIDMIFIDSAHEYQKTLDEIIASDKILSDKGFIFIHDTTNGNVLAAIKEFIKNKNNYTYSNFPTQYGLGVLKRK